MRLRVCGALSAHQAGPELELRLQRHCLALTALKTHYTDDTMSQHCGFNPLTPPNTAVPLTLSLVVPNTDESSLTLSLVLAFVY